MAEQRGLLASGIFRISERGSLTPEHLFYGEVLKFTMAKNMSLSAAENQILFCSRSVNAAI